MYSRFRDGLLSPSSIIDYIKDRWYRPLFQILLYALLLVIPTVISIATYDGLSYDQKLAVRQSFNNEEINFVIENGELNSLNGDDVVFKKEINEMFQVVITEQNFKSDDLTDIYSIVFEKEKITVRFSTLEFDVLTYSEVDSLKNFDLRKLGKYDNINEWDVIFFECDTVIEEFMGYVIASMSLITFLQCVMTLAMFAFVISLTFVFRFSKILKFSAMYKMGVYYLAPYAVGNLLASLLGMAVFYYVGVIFSIIYSIIGSNVIVSKLINQGRK